MESCIIGFLIFCSVGLIGLLAHFLFEMWKHQESLENVFKEHKKYEEKE